MRRGRVRPRTPAASLPWQSSPSSPWSSSSIYQLSCDVAGYCLAVSKAQAPPPARRPATRGLQPSAADRHSSGSPWHAHAFSLPVDGLEIVASFMLLAQHRSSRRPGWLQWATLVVIGTGGSLAVNARPVPAPSARSLPPGPLARQIRRAAAIPVGRQRDCPVAGDMPAYAASHRTKRWPRLPAIVD